MYYLSDFDKILYVLYKTNYIFTHVGQAMPDKYYHNSFDKMLYIQYT